MRAALYCRVSTEDQAREGFSLAAQERRLRDFCLARGWTIADTYVDDGHSGRTTARPEYQRMLAERDGWDVLAVLKMDRIHRNARNFMEMMEDLHETGKDFASATESFDTSTAMGRFVMDIIQRIAQLESEQIGERVYMGMSQKAKAGGGTLGSPNPYGYRIEEGRYVIEDSEAKTVREIFKRYVGGESLGAIAEAIDRSGIPTKRGGRWRKQTIAAILANPLHSGRIRWDGHEAVGTHERLISAEMFERALAERIRRRRPGVPRPSLPPVAAAEA